MVPWDHGSNAFANQVTHTHMLSTIAYFLLGNYHNKGQGAISLLKLLGGKLTPKLVYFVLRKELLKV